MRYRLRNLLLGLTVAATVAGATGCVYRPAPVYVGAHCGEVWVPGHYDPAGYYRAGHWRCANGAVYYR